MSRCCSEVQVRKKVWRRSESKKAGARLPRSTLDDDGFLIFAEDAAEGVGDFADRGVGFDGGEDSRKKILGGRGAALEFGEGGFGADRIALGAGRSAGRSGSVRFARRYGEWE